MFKKVALFLFAAACSFSALAYNDDPNVCPQKCLVNYDLCVKSGHAEHACYIEYANCLWGECERW
ncbi:hypothetical protein [Massilia sp. BJB1822]|uniref:hypothetical protein n=1 Tax=Massilia sp. BJB1822 TaxID=2744470 RepID=UPI001592CF59|nr:hypothetical protein [Massilia sp. BJB1822]NVE01008.1 hypothetical protein [Massilia sp. BJB1822]